MTTNPTSNYGFSRPNFNQVTWHDDINDNWTLCDALFKAVGITSVVGAWQNNTAYTVGDRVIDATDGTTWKCNVNHTSAASGTFAADRSANPTYWESVVTGVVVRGAFVPGSTYLINEFVYESSQQLAGIVQDAFVGGASLRDNIADLGVIVDLNADLATKANLSGGNVLSGIQQITGGYSGAPISTLVGGTTGGGLIQGQNSGHIVIGLKDNDGADSFSIVSGGGDYMTDTTYDTLVARFRADGLATLGNTINLNAGIYKTVANSLLTLAGGSTNGGGANIELYGESHATQANNAFYDAGIHTFRNQSGGDVLLTLDPAGDLVTVSGTTPPFLMIDRTSNSVNSHIGYKGTGATPVYAGLASDGEFGIGSSTNLQSNAWARFTSSQITFGSKLQLTGGGELIELRSASASVGPAYLRFEDSTGANIGYAGMGGSNNAISLARNVAGQLDFDAGSGGFINLSLGSEVARFQGTSFLVGSTVGIDPNTGSQDGVNLTTAGGVIASNNSNVAGNFRRRGTDGRAINVFKNTTAVGGANVTAAATSWDTSSDERLKNFIGPYDPMEAIRIIRADPVRDFTWNHFVPDAEGQYAVGWGAQTSYALSKDLASPGIGEPGEKGFQPWGVDQGKRTPYLWAATSYLVDKAEEFEARLAALEAA